jgi:hypothetical protein
MTAARLLRLRWPELWCRSRQEMRKGLERIGLLGSRDAFTGVFGRLARAPELDAIRKRARGGDLGGAARDLFERWRAAAPARFFDGAVSPEVPALVRARTGGADTVVAAAEAVRARRFDLLGYRALDFGDPPDWHLDPVSGRRAPLRHWSRIDPLDAARVGDSKVIWELNRHQWLVTLGQAYRLTGNERYAEAVRDSVLGWMRDNPPGVGINWASSLEVALRMISWCWTLHLVLGARALSPELFASLLGGIAVHAAHVERYLSYYFSPNTHLTGEALGLCYAGFCAPELGGASRWRRLGQQILLTELDRQVEADGAHFERSTCYQRYTAEIYLHSLLLAARNGVAVPAAVGERLERMIEVLLALRRPDGTMPRIGDGDGGSLLPLPGRGPDDVRGLFACAAATFGRADFAWAAGGDVAEPLWLGGPAALARLDELVPRPPAGTAPLVFPDGGWAVLRSGWDDRGHQLIVDVGPIGCPVSAGHGHADLLSVECAAFGEPIVADPGTYCYTADAAWRDFFRGTAAHSTVTIDGVGQAIPRGPFGWTSRPEARLRRVLTGERLDVVDAEHRAYERLPDPVVHRRRVLWVKPRYWVIVDDLQGAAVHRVELRFQLAPVETTVEDGQWVRARSDAGHGLLICPFAAVPLEQEVFVGSRTPIQGWVAPHYGRRQPAPVLVYTADAPLPLRIATILMPVADALAPRPEVTLILDGARPIGLSVDGRDIVSFAEPESLYSLLASEPGLVHSTDDAGGR